MRRAGLILASMCLSLSLIPAVASAGSSGTSPAPPAPSGKAIPVRVANPAAYARAKAQAALRVGQRHAPTQVAGPSAPSIGLQWDGVFDTRVTPPDPTGAVGRNSYIELINLTYGIYNRAGGLINIGGLAALTGAANDFNLSDPQILWDARDQRFYYVVLNVMTNHLMWGFSKDANPQSSADFCKYDGDFAYGSALPDYPKLGNTRFFLLIGVNVFNPGYVGSDVDWIRKGSIGPNPIVNCPAANTFALGKFSRLRNADQSLAFTPVPPVSTDTGGFSGTPEGFVVATKDVSFGAASFLSAFPVFLTSGPPPRLGAPFTVPVPAYSVPPDAPQCNTSKLLSTLDGRLEHAVLSVDPARGNLPTIWTSHAVFGGAGSEQRWYEIRGTIFGATLLQSGVATSPSLYAWNGAISSDRRVGPDGSAFGASMVMGFNTSNATTCSAIQMVSKIGANPQSGFVLVKQSPGKNVDFFCATRPSCRWGDYSGATPDPAASLARTTGQVWLSGEWNVASLNDTDVDARTENWMATP